MRSVGEVFTTIERHDSGNTSYGVKVGSERWFVKYAQHAHGIRHLENALRFHAGVRHPAIVPVRGILRAGPGVATVSPWVEGEPLKDPLALGGLPYADPRSALSRFRALAVAEILAALDALFDAHVAIAGAGFVAEDFYDGCVMYDFASRRTHLYDLDHYQPGPRVLDRDRQFGSERFMAPEEFQRGAVIDERTTVFNLARAAFVFLSESPRGGTSPESWRASRGLYEVAMRATSRDPDRRYQSVAEFVAAWRDTART